MTAHLHIFHAETTDRLLVFGSNGRFYTLSASNLPGGRGMGEPVRLMVDLPNEAEIVALFIHRPGQKLSGRLFRRRWLSSCRKTTSSRKPAAGKQVLNVKGETRAAILRARSLAITSRSSGRTERCWSSRFPSLNEMTRGKGVRLQKYKDGGLSDARTFDLAGRANLA